MPKAKKTRLRAVFPADCFSVGKIDAEAGVLHDVLICQEGEAKGHDVWLGSPFIEQVVDEGNKQRLGVRVRFGHPAMCSDALGTYIGRAKNFKVVQKKREDGTLSAAATADLYLSDEAKIAPSGDLYSWVLTAAEKSPSAFGMSIVFTYADFYVVGKDGKRILRTEAWRSKEKEREWEDAVDAGSKKYALLDKLIGSDFTDRPAATDGVFSVESVAGNIEEFLDENPSVLEALTSDQKRVAEFIERFNAYLSENGRDQIVLPGRVETPEEFKTRLDAALAEKDSKIAELTAKIADLTKQGETLTADLAKEKELREGAEKTAQENLEKYEAEQKARLNIVGGTLSGVDETFSTWSEAFKELGYERARNQYPELYQEFMNKNTKKTGGRYA